MSIRSTVNESGTAIASNQTFTDPSHQESALNFIRRGTTAYRKAGFALFLLGFASFSMIYCVQPLLPEFTHTFHISPGTSALALSLTTGFWPFPLCFPAHFLKPWVVKV